MFRKFLLFSLIFFLFSFVFSTSWKSFDGSKEGTPVDVKVISSNNNKTVVDITIHGFYVSKIKRDGLTFDLISLPGEEYLRNIGKPQLPSIGRLLAIPNGKKVKFKISEGDFFETDNLFIFPAQPEPTRCGKKKLPFRFDTNFYNRDTRYPGYLIKTSKPKVFRDVRNIRFAFFPIQYNPIKNTAKIFTHIKVEFDYYGKDNRNNVTNENVPVDPTFYRIYRDTFINYPLISRAKSLSDREKILIFVADDLSNTINDFVDWKKKCGYEVFIEYMSNVGASVDNIKNKISQYYNNPDTRPTYVIMVGDENTIPPDYRSTANGNAASDYTYELMDGNDNDPDVIVGRIVASSESEANIQFDKIIHYEEYPDTGSGADWYTKCVGIASDEGSNPSDAEYIDQITTVLINHTYTYRDQFLQGEGTATSQNINNALNEGRTWLTYIGHGSITGWGSTNDTYDVNTIDQLTNGYKLPIIIDVACENGHYDGNDCFAEKWMRAGSVGNPKGAVGIYAGTVSVSWHPPAIMAKGVAIRHYDDPHYTFGGSCIAGQLYLEANWNNEDDVVDNMEWYTIFGDPSMFMRTDTPVTLNVTHDSIFPLGSTTFSVSVTNSSGDPIEGARVYAYSDAEEDVKSYGITDSNGNVTLTFSQGPNYTGNLHIWVTGYNFVPNSSVAQITGDSTCTPPSNLSVSNSGNNDVLITWDSTSADSYMIYRAVGDCSETAFEVIASGVTENSYHDTAVEGGYTYSYKIRSVCGDTPGTETSECKSITATGSCDLPPDFDGLESIEQPLEEQCKLILHWNPATSNCPNNPEIYYNVYRSTAGTKDFSLIASNITGTSYTDTSVVSGTTYQYKVRAVDGAGNEDGNDVVLSSTPLGPVYVQFSDDMESTEPNGWSHEAAQGTDDWAYNTSEYHSETHSWFSSDADSVKDDYLYTPTIDISQNSKLYFWHKFDMENGYDGCVLEISTDGGSTWQDMGNYIIQNGYNGNISSSYNSPIGGRSAWTGAVDWCQVIVDLSNFSGDSAIFRFRLASDSSVNKTGWWIDDVSVKQSQSCSSQEFQDGDLNQDGNVNSVDAVILANYLSGIISQGEGGFTAPLEKADMNGDGAVDAVDLLLILLNQ